MAPAQIDELAEQDPLAARRGDDPVGDGPAGVRAVYQVGFGAAGSSNSGEISRSRSAAQAWGATFRLDDPGLHDMPRAVEAEFDVLSEVLHARMIDRLSRETVQDVRSRILQFPLAFEALRPQVSHFIDALCQVDPYRDSPILRGFYFSSGTQTGASMDRVLVNMHRGFDLRPNVGVEPNRPGTTHSYFVTELFEKVIFPDRHLALHSTVRSRRRTIQQILMGCTALTITLIAVLPAMVSFGRNRDLIADSVNDVGKARTYEGSSTSTAAAADVLLGRVRELEGQEGELRIPGFWGPRSAPPTARRRAGSLQGASARDRQRAGSRRPDCQRPRHRQSSSGRRRELQERLRRPEALPDADLPRASEHGLGSAAPDAGVAAARWAAKAAAAAKRSKTHTRRYLKAFAADPSWTWPADATAIGRARGRLVSQPLEELRYGWLVEKTKDIPAVKPSKIFFGASAQYFSARDNVEVRGLYTVGGWERVRAALASSDAEFDFEPWVLGQDIARGPDGSGAKRLRELYFERYVRAWSDFMGALSVASSPNIKTADDELRVLTEANGPYIRLFRTLSENTTLDMEPVSLTDKALAKGEALAAQALAKAAPGVDAGLAKEREISTVERHFQPLNQFAFGESGKASKDAPPSGLNQYLAQLTTLEVALTQLNESRTEPGEAFTNELSRTASAVQRLLGGLDSRTRLLVEPLLMTPIRGSAAGAFIADHSALSDRWKAEVWETWNTTLGSAFSVQRGGQRRQRGGVLGLLPSAAGPDLEVLR